MLLCTLKMVYNNIRYDSAKTARMEKICFFSYGLKCTQLIRLQCSLITSMSERNQFFAWKESSKKDSILSVIFGWVLPDVLVVQSDCSILWSTVSLDKSNWYLRFFAWRYASRKGSIWEFHLWLGVAFCISFSMILLNFGLNFFTVG